MGAGGENIETAPGGGKVGVGGWGEGREDGVRNSTRK